MAEAAHAVVAAAGPSFTLAPMGRLDSVTPAMHHRSHGGIFCDQLCMSYLAMTALCCALKLVLVLPSAVVWQYTRG